MSKSKKAAQLREDIKTLTDTIKDPDTPEDMRSELQESLDAVKKELEELLAQKEEKVSREKTPKSEYMFNGKSLKETSLEELEAAFEKRMTSVDERESKAKTKSVLTKK